MAESVKFPGANKKYFSKEGPDIYVHEMAGHAQTTIMCFKLSMDELAEIHETGKIWVAVDFYGKFGEVLVQVPEMVTIDDHDGTEGV